MSDWTIEKVIDGGKGRYLLREGTESAELTFNVTSPTLVIADHTDVSDGLRGTGAGRALVERLVSDARSDGFKILPLCPFVNAERRKHPDWADAFQV